MKQLFKKLLMSILLLSMVSLTYAEERVQTYETTTGKKKINSNMVFSGNNVGIGTTNPGAALAVGADAFKVTSLGAITSGTWSATDISLAAGGTGQSLTDPNADGILLWDDSDTGIEWDFAVIGSGLSYDGTTLTATSSGASTALDNLAAVAINTSLISDTDSTDDLGSAAKDWANVYTDAVHISKLGTNTLYVGTGGDYTTIQVALNAAVAGDTILVAEGTYTEAITFGDDNVTLKAIGSKENTTITQAAATVVDFGLMEGCVLEGFTVSVTAANGTVDYVITGANDTANNTPNIIRNCDILWTDDGNAHSGSSAVKITDGDWEWWNCYIFSDVNYSGASNNAHLMYYNLTNAGTHKFYNCKFKIDSETTGAQGFYMIYSAVAGCTYDFWDCEWDGAVPTTGTNYALGLSINNGTTTLYNCDLKIANESSGEAIGIYAYSGYICYNTTFNITSSSGNAYWTDSATVDAWGVKVIAGDETGGTVTNYDTNEKGIITNAKNSGARAYLSAVSQNVSTATATKVAFDAETYDIQGEFDSTTNNRFTATVAGYYQVNTAVMYDSPTADKYYEVMIRKNGSSTNVGFAHASTTTQVSVVCSATVYLAANDYIEIFTYHAAGVTETIKGTYTEQTWVEVNKIR